MRRLFAPSPRLFGSLALVSLQLRFSFAKEAKPCQPHKLLCIFGFASSARLRQSRRSEEPSQHACTSSAKPKKEAFALVLLRLHKCSLLRSASSALRFFGFAEEPKEAKGADAKASPKMRRSERTSQRCTKKAKAKPPLHEQSFRFLGETEARSSGFSSTSVLRLCFLSRSEVASVRCFGFFRFGEAERRRASASPKK
uniref:Uncharacterized protein n=1 Tax=Pediastrum duplex TaxID=3105 RepID=A0A2U8GI18_PEDDU|nr:hypothetical protein [Pediastrum duplex]